MKKSLWAIGGQWRLHSGDWRPEGDTVCQAPPVSVLWPPSRVSHLSSHVSRVTVLTPAAAENGHRVPRVARAQPQPPLGLVKLLRTLVNWERDPADYSFSSSRTFSWLSFDLKVKVWPLIKFQHFTLCRSLYVCVWDRNCATFKMKLNIKESLNVVILGCENPFPYRDRMFFLSFFSIRWLMFLMWWGNLIGFGIKVINLFHWLSFEWKDWGQSLLSRFLVVRIMRLR